MFPPFFINPLDLLYPVNLLSFIPFYDYFIALATVYTKEADPGSQNVLNIILDNSGLIEGLATLITVIGSTVGVGVTWLRKQNVKQYTILKTEILGSFEILKTETTQDIKNNQRQIQEVKESLGNQISNIESNLNYKLDVSKESLSEIKKVVEKIDEKIDNNMVNIAKNTSRIDTQTDRIEDLEGEVYSSRRKDNSFRVNNRRGNDTE